MNCKMCSNCIEQGSGQGKLHCIVKQRSCSNAQTNQGAEERGAVGKSAMLLKWFDKAIL